MENHHFLIGQATNEWEFSVAFCMFTRGYRTSRFLAVLTSPHGQGQSDDPKLRDVHWAQCLQGVQLLGQRRPAAGSWLQEPCQFGLLGFIYTHTYIHIYITLYVWLEVSLDLITECQRLPTARSNRCRHNVDVCAWMYPDKSVKCKLAALPWQEMILSKHT